jgi:hypothetical protein
MSVKLGPWHWKQHRLKVFKNRVLRRIFGPKRNKVAGGWRKLRNEDLHNLYFLPTVIRIMKSRRMRWWVRVARMQKNRNTYRILVEKPEGQRSLGRWRQGGWIMLRWILGRYAWVMWTGLIWFRIGSSWGLLWTWLWTFGFSNMLGSSWVFAQLVTYWGFSSMELVS